MLANQALCGFAHWGPQRASAWVLRIFGSVVLVFTIVSNLASEWTGWAALLLHPLLASQWRSSFSALC